MSRMALSVLTLITALKDEKTKDYEVVSSVFLSLHEETSKQGSYSLTLP